MLYTLINCCVLPGIARSILFRSGQSPNTLIFVCFCCYTKCQQTKGHFLQSACIYPGGFNLKTDRLHGCSFLLNQFSYLLTQESTNESVHLGNGVAPKNLGILFSKPSNCWGFTRYHPTCSHTYFCRCKTTNLKARNLLEFCKGQRQPIKVLSKINNTFKRNQSWGSQEDEFYNS